MAREDGTLTTLRGIVPQLRAMLDAARREQGVEGMSAALVHDQTVLLADGFGWADRENGVEAAADTVYPVGSVTKVFTATMLMQLRDAGVVGLDDPIARHLPGFKVKSPFPDATRPTFRQAASHTTGLQRDPVIWIDGEAHFLDFRETAPLAAHRDMYLDENGDPIADLSKTGHLAVGVPGSVAGLWEAHQKFGSLPWRDLVMPAVALARDGYVVHEHLAGNIERGLKKFDGRTNFANYFAGAATAGEIFRKQYEKEGTPS